jgi:hypothetical protein
MGLFIFQQLPLAEILKKYIYSELLMHLTSYLIETDAESISIIQRD